MKLVENISKADLSNIKQIVGKAFITNELFHEFGDLDKRKELVMKYMEIYIDCVYEAKALYQSDDGFAFIGLAYSDDKATIPQLKMLVRLLCAIPFSTIKKFLNHIKQIKDGNSQYAKNPHLEIHMVCVSADHQGQGYAKMLVDFAKQRAAERKVPILFDTDMESYAKMYEYFGCKLYHTKTASNGVTRYNLIWEESKQ